MLIFCARAVGGCATLNGFAARAGAQAANVRTRKLDHSLGAYQGYAAGAHDLYWNVNRLSRHPGHVRFVNDGYQLHPPTIRSC